MFLLFRLLGQAWPTILDVGVWSNALLVEPIEATNSSGDGGIWPNVTEAGLKACFLVPS